MKTIENIKQKFIVKKVCILPKLCYNIAWLMVTKKFLTIKIYILQHKKTKRLLYLPDTLFGSL